MNHKHPAQTESIQPCSHKSKVPLSIARTLHRLAHDKQVNDAQYIELAREMIVPAVQKIAIEHLGKVESEPQRNYHWPFHPHPLVNIAVGIATESLYQRSQARKETAWRKAWAAVGKVAKPRKLNDAAAYIASTACNAVHAELKKGSPSAALWDAVRAALGKTTGFVSVPEDGRDLYAPTRGARWHAAANFFRTDIVHAGLGRP